MARYLKCGDRLFALNPKVATSSFARAIIKRWHPAVETTITSASYPEGKSADTGQWQMMIPYRTRPHGEVICLVREPVERFRSAMAQVRLTDVEATLAELRDESGTHPEYVALAGRSLLSEDPHFLPQSRFSGQPIRYFRFHDQLDAAAQALDLPLPLLRINERSDAQKPPLTAEQERRVRDLYADDVSLWESLQ